MVPAMCMVSRHNKSCRVDICSLQVARKDKSAGETVPSRGVFYVFSKRSFGLRQSVAERST
jgi:hypothetical protein